MKRLRNKPLHLIRTSISALRAARIRCGGKKIVIRALCILLVAVVAAWAFAPEISSAQTPIPTQLGRGALTGISKVAEAITAVGYILGILWILQIFLSTVALAVAGALLNFAYTLNVIITPADLIVVQEGWRLLRDLSNGLLILVILWIAITIILNLEEYGGRRLLVRVITAGLLINFSLMFVSIPFAFGNQLARPFLKALNLAPECKSDQGQKCNELADLIINNSEIHTTSRIITEQGVDAAFQADIKKLKTAAATRQGDSSSLWEYVGAPRTAHAAPPLLMAAAGYLAYLAAATIAGALSSALTYVFLYATGWDKTLVLAILNLALANMLLFFTVISIAMVAVILLLRIIAMIFLGVFAPLAFISLAIPRYGDRIWNPWLNNLLRWAFVGPIFYFLLYLALLMLQLNRSGTESFLTSNVPLTSNLFKIINFALFFIFLWAAVYFTRKTAGQFAEVALSGLRRGLGYAGGYGLGVLKRRALPYLGRTATAAEERIGRIKSPFARGLLRQPAGALRGIARAGREQVLRDQQQFRSMTSAEIQRTIGGGGLTESQLAAAMLTLQQNKDLKPLRDSRGNFIAGYTDDMQQRGKNTIRRAGLDIAGFLRANPALARPTDFRQNEISGPDAQQARTEAQQALGRPLTDIEFAQWLAWQRVRPPDFDAMDLGILDEKTQEGRTQIAMLLASQRGESFTRLGRINPARAQRVQEHLEQHPEIWAQFDEKKRNYFTSNAARELVWALPPYARGAGGATAPAGGGTGTSAGSASPAAPFQIRNTDFATSIRAGTTGYRSAPLVTGGTSPYTITVESGSLPPNLGIDAAGRITGDIASVVPSGTLYTAQVRIDDGAGATGTVTIRINVT